MYMCIQYCSFLSVMIFSPLFHCPVPMTPSVYGVLLRVDLDLHIATYLNVKDLLELSSSNTATVAKFTCIRCFIVIILGYVVRLKG